MLCYNSWGKNIWWKKMTLSQDFIFTFYTCSLFSKWVAYKGSVRKSKRPAWAANDWCQISLSFEFQSSKRLGRSLNSLVKSLSSRPQFYWNTNQIHNWMIQWEESCGMYIYMFSYLYSYNNKRIRFIWKLLTLSNKIH